jgi:hypothetical protein
MFGRARRHERRPVRRRRGQAALEFLLLIAFFILPMSFLCWGMLQYQRDMFHVVAWFLSLPVP